MSGARRYPLISTWLDRRAVAAWAASATGSGDCNAVRELVEVVCSDGDRAIYECAYRALSTLTAPAAIDGFCTEVMARNHPVLTSLAKEKKYVPDDRTSRALFCAVMCDNGADTLPGPFIDTTGLARGYAGADLRVQEGVLAAVLAKEHCARMTDVLIKQGQGAHPVFWSPRECDVIMGGLLEQNRRDELWHALFSFPIPQAIAALHALNKSDWAPPGKDRIFWKDLIAALPEQGGIPVPEPRLCTNLEQPSGQTTRLCFSPDSSLLVTAGSDGMIRCWQVSRGTLRYSFGTGTGAVRFLAITPDGTRIIVQGNDNCMRCHDLQSGDPAWDENLPRDQTGNLVIPPDSTGVISGDADGNILMTGMQDGVTRISGNIPGSAINHLAISPDGRTLVIAGAARTAYSFDIITKTVILTFTRPYDDLRNILFTPYGSRCVLVPDRSLPVVIHAGTGNRERTFAGHAGKTVCGCLSPDGNTLCIGSDDRTLRIWNLNDGRCITRPMYNRRPVSCGITPDSNRLITGCSEGTIRIFELPSGLLIKEFKAHKGPVTSVTCSSDGRHLASCGWDGTVKLWNIPSFDPERIIQGEAGEIRALCATSNGSIIFAGSVNGTVRVFDAIQGQSVRILDMYTPKIFALAVSTDGSLLACAGKDATLTLWNAADGSLVATCEGLTTSVRCLAFTHDGTLLISGGWDGKIRYWQVTTGRLLKTIAGHTSVVTSCAISPDGTVLVTGSNDTTIRLWDIRDGTSHRELAAGRHEVSALACSGDGRVFAWGTTEGTLGIRYFPDGEERGVLKSVPGKVTALAFTDDREALVAGYDSGVAIVCLLATGEIIASYPAHAGALTGLFVIPGKNLMVTSGQDGAVRTWHLPWTRSLNDTTPEDIPRVVREIAGAPDKKSAGAWNFSGLLIRAKFRHAIGLCDNLPVAGIYDIQIAG